MLSKKRIIHLYSDLSFSGSYYSSHSFYAELIRKFGKKNVPDFKTVTSILETIPTFQIHSPYKKTKRYRPLDNVTGQGISLQLDLAFMPLILGFAGFLIAVDEWNNFVYVSPFSNKSQKSIEKCILDIISKPSLRNVCIFSSDKGSEFVSNTKFASSRGIKWLFLTSNQKAFLAERYIRIVKGKLYRAMRDQKTAEWPTLLTPVVKSINSTYSSFLGMTPDESNTPYMDPKIRAVWDKKAIKRPEITTKIETWKVGDYVYRQLKASPLYKG